MRDQTFEDKVVGVGPQGGNSIDGDSDGYNAITNASIQAVPLFWDGRVGAYISELAMQELDDIDASLILHDEFQEAEEFRARIGYRQS